MRKIMKGLMIASLAATAVLGTMAVGLLLLVVDFRSRDVEFPPLKTLPPLSFGFDAGEGGMSFHAKNVRPAAADADECDCHEPLVARRTVQSFQ